MFCVPVITYAAPALYWTEEELRTLDIKTRKLLIANSFFHANSCTVRLYIPRRDGGRGLLNIQNQIHHIIKKTKHNIMKRQEEDKILSVIDTDKICEAPCRKFLADHLAKPLHGSFLMNIDNKKASLNWLKKTNIAKEVERTIFVLQEQAFPTAYYKSKVEKKQINIMCRICKSQPETVAHLLSGCPTLAKKQYLVRHNSVGKYVYTQFCKMAELAFSKTQDPPKVNENGLAKILWDFTIQTHNNISHNRPDMIYIDKKQNKAIIIDFSVPWDTNVHEKYKEKVAKYLQLSNCMKLLWNLKHVKIYPMVIGCLGSCTAQMAKDIESIRSDLGVDINLQRMQTLAMTQSVRIMSVLPQL